MRDEKLVRDYIPRIAGYSADSSQVRVALAEERLSLLLDKLEEECSEVRLEPSLEEIADVVEVLKTLALELGSTWSAVEFIADKKREERGGFSEGFVLSIVSVTPNGGENGAL